MSLSQNQLQCTDDDANLELSLSGVQIQYNSTLFNILFNKTVSRRLLELSLI